MLRRMTRGAGAGRVVSRAVDSAHGRLEVAAAVAREHLISVHVEKALELIELASGRVDHSRTLQIYSRLHALTPDTEDLVRTRTLAVLGEREVVPRTAEVVQEEVDGEDRTWLVSVLGERFRPRVRNDLRRWMELHSGRAETALIEAHVENALRFVDILAELSFSEAIAVYVDMLPLPPALASMVQFFALERLSRDHLPAKFWKGRERPAGAQAAEGSAAEIGEDRGSPRTYPFRRGRPA